LAAAVADDLGSELLQTDAVRREIYGPNTSQAANYATERYLPQHRERVYEELFRRAEKLLGEGLSLVLDGTFLTNELRQRGVELARRNGAMPLVVHCRCPGSVAEARLADRLARGGSLSDARPELYALQQLDEQPPSAELPCIEVDTTACVTAQVAQVIEWLSRKVFA
jgi:predicted kinase